jgi:ectoine hydroxylase-related dioxygenase (phytanoyl-CoA dioxygenase family)
MLTGDQIRRWDEDGFFIVNGFVDQPACHAISAETVAEIRADPPAAHPGEPAYATAGGLFIQPEARPTDGAAKPEELVSKVFNPHLVGFARDFAVSERAAAIVAELLGGDVDVFQSMFILKNRGAWGQPWHQDSHYFDFDPQPQVGLWLALTEATRENGCLSVLPGSHKGAILPHAPDRRPGANQGYLEVPGIDDARAVEVRMKPGDLLVFHSFLLHRSVDHVGGPAREAMVYHYARAGTVNRAPEHVQTIQRRINHWVPAWRTPPGEPAHAERTPAEMTHAAG